MATSAAASSPPIDGGDGRPGGYAVSGVASNTWYPDGQTLALTAFTLEKTQGP